ncbi:MAG: CoB--CoM heterodisulfide reductase iron-sulfur subunit A family protein [Candidatus Odinarchaeota archaeon]|nr:CoB--CoM heterodisulfide reductase iron-sulfur subunit A family protein [Candidatus Odinarchaeota archaeon]
MSDNEKADSVLVYGTSVCGQRVAANFAKYGYQVYLINKGRYIGEIPSQAETLRPRNICNTCLRFVLHKIPHVKKLNDADVIKVEGEPGNYTVTIKQREPFVDQSKCIVCHRCVDACPVSVEDKDVRGDTFQRKAIYPVYRPVVPITYLIDEEHCTKCGECVNVCPTSAINLNPQEKEFSVNVGAIVVAPEYKEADKKELEPYGYGVFKNVVKLSEVDRWFLGYGLDISLVRRPSDKQVPHSIAIVATPFMERSIEDTSYMSDARAIEMALLLKSLNEKLTITVFMKDLHLYGKGQYAYYKEAIEKGIRFVFVERDVKVSESSNGNIVISADESNEKDEFELVILSAGQIPDMNWKELEKKFGISISDNGYCNVDLTSLETNRPGIFACGEILGPSTDIESLLEGAAIPVHGLQYLGTPYVKKMMQKNQQNEPSEMWDLEEPNEGVFICTCGGLFEKTVDVDKVIDIVKSNGYKNVYKVDYLCQKNGLEFLKKTIKENKLNRILLFSCAPNFKGGTFAKAMQEIGLSPSLYDMFPFKEYIAWTHDDIKQSTKKAVDMILLWLSKLEDAVPVKSPYQDVYDRTLVIGGGIAGLNAALRIANAGKPVDLIERTDKLGGYGTLTDYSLDGINIEAYTKELIRKVSENKLINVYLSTEVENITGYAGKYNVVLKRPEESEERKYGVIILANGGIESPLLDIQNKNLIISFSEMEQNLKEQNLSFLDGKSNLVFYLQGPLNKESPYSSINRLVATIALKNALKLKELRHDLNITILYPDFVAFGRFKSDYQHALSQGIKFYQSDPLSNPVIKEDSGKLKIEAVGACKGKKISLEADLIVGSIVPSPTPDNKHFSELLGVPLDNDGFLAVNGYDPYEKINIKLRPFDFGTNGIFVAGLSSSPKTLKETLIESNAAANGALMIVNKQKVPPPSGVLVSVTNERICAGCAYCVTACPYNARYIDEETKVAKVITSVCDGCGACVTACPSGAAQVISIHQKQIISMLDELPMNLDEKDY